jgi:hypothetical protein
LQLKFWRRVPITTVTEQFFASPGMGPKNDENDAMTIAKRLAALPAAALVGILLVSGLLLHDISRWTIPCQGSSSYRR